MKQTGVIQRDIEVVVLDYGMSQGKFTPSEAKTLVKDENGKPESRMFRYLSIVGMLLYLSGHTFPDFAFQMNSCSRYMFRPKLSHKLTYNRLDHYLNQTKYCGLVLNPNYYACKLDAYTYDNFSGIYGHYDPTDHECVESRNDFFITFADFLDLWISNSLTNTALSTIEAEIIVIDHCCR